MRVLDLFSGIGGFSLGLERAGHETVAFCEIDKFCQKVLEKCWPEVPIFKDITHLRFDGAAKVLYDDRHGQKKTGLSPSSNDVSIRPVGSGSGDILRCYPPSDVGMAESSESRDAPQSSFQGGESLLSGEHKGRRPSAEHVGNSNTKGDYSQEVDMRDLRRFSDIQEWKNGGSGTSFGLQQASGRDVAMSEMPLRMAQEQQGEKESGKEVDHGSHANEIDIICGGFP